VTGTTSAGRPIRRYLIGLIGIAIVALGIVVASQIGTLFPGGAAAATGTPGPAGEPSPSNVAVEPSTTPPTAPPPTPEPTPELVPAPMTGVLVSPEAAAQHPIAVMIDDQFDARPQSGFNAASVVWHAPAEGGIPRYMLIFQEEIPTDIGPVRSARQYYIEWAAEWNATYVHHGGSPQALNTLSARGSGQWVWNADGFRWSGFEGCARCYLWRTTDRFAPHNVYTDGKHLRRLAKRLGAKDEPMDAAWTFGPDKAAELRPDGGVIKVSYPYELITYRYDAATNTYPRYIDGSKKPQVDRADGEVVAPKNVVILRMVFGPLNDGSHKNRLEAQNIGKGEAWISTGGVTVKGQWRKKSATAPTRLFGPDGEPITLTAGQTFVQVIPTTYTFKIRDAETASIATRLLGLLGP
jgi:Protein of unknown function (DUF3048) N-terminal domain/Protein of unknown function (DUF3048) C-terminal domain